ncbi:MAG TPA: AMP-binding protein [Burkholderiaceae bacterium]|nr:AMP-binding protein [Burkholderiaceae bacterium]
MTAQDVLTPAEVLALYPPHDDTIPSLLHSRCRTRPGAEAMRFEVRTWTYADLDHASDLLGDVVAGLGVQKGDRVALVASNSDVAILLFLALARRGAIFVPVNPVLTVSELRYILGHCRPRLIVAAPAEAERIGSLAVGLPGAPPVLDIDSLGAAQASAADVMAVIAARAGTKSTAVKIDANDPAVVIYTSGTTGLPKGVLHSQRNYVWAGEAFVERMRLQPSDRLLTMLPFYHVNALFYSCGGALAAGGTLITAAGFSASRLWDVAAACGATVFNTIAAVGNILAKRPRSEFNSGHTIRKIYGGPISAEMCEVFQNEFHIPDLIEGYGMSEIPGACNNPFDGPRKIGSIGKPARHPRLGGTFVQMKVIDESGSEVPVGKMGEVVVRTPIVMLGYLDDPEQTRAAFLDGWFRTGDVAWRDEDGYFYFVTRKKDIIRRRGENISGAEIDRVLASHPDILEAAAIGVPSELGEDEILAVLVARTPQHPAPAAIVQWCAQQLAPMKVPRYIVFVDAMPHSASQRVAKFRLKEDTTLLARAFDRAPARPGR